MHLPSQKRGSRALRLSCAGSIALGILVMPVLAQDLGLRTEPASDDSLQTEAAQEQVAQQIYQPISPGALPENDPSTMDGSAGTPSIFDPDQATADDPFADPNMPLQPTLPTSPEASQTATSQPRRTVSRSNLPPRTLTEADEQVARTLSTSSLAAASQAERKAQARALIAGRESRANALDSRGRIFEDEPFAPVGMRLGTTLLYPSIEQGLTASSNANSSAGGRSGVLSETTLRLNAATDWSRHAATLDSALTIRRSLDGEEIKEVRGSLSGGLRLDLADGYALNALVGYEAGPESASSPVVIEGTLDEPTQQVFTGSVALSKEAGRLRVSGTTSVEREIYGDAQLSTGGTLSQADRDSTLASFTLRTGYEISPALIPFVEAEIGKRFYDEKFDSAGYQRSGLRTGLRAGLAFDFTEKWSGEVSAGWLGENYDDDRLGSLSAPTVAADIRWSPMRGTIVGLNGQTLVEGTTTPGQSGSVLYTAALTATREIRANLSGTASIGLGYRDYKGIDGRDFIWNAETSLTYWMNRYAGVTGRLRYEELTSNLAGRDYDATSIYLGLKLQR